MEKIVLYQYEDCPFCAKVRDKLEEMNLKYEAVEVSKDPNDVLRMEMQEKTGVSTVPVIKIGEMFIGDSDTIIAYLEKHHQ